ncbi:MAG: hypothetical protein KKH75_03150 [Actinobacteria bacterium]|nr:hypothetical protein [Actinomycetota bacterium]
MRRDLVADIADILGIIVGILGVPFTLWTVVRVLWPELVSGNSDPPGCVQETPAPTAP